MTIGTMFRIRHAILCTTLLSAGGAGMLGLHGAHAQEPGQVAFGTAPAAVQPYTMNVLAAARAADRLVAVGEQGMVLLSDDDGAQWRQAKQVPFDGLLTSVSFPDGSEGWAVGHAGAILHTEDAGETWSVQRTDTSVDQPLFAVHFFDRRHGVAVGLWSLVLVTDDGGANWQQQTLPAPDGARRADLNLFNLFVNPRGELFAPAERGRVLRSTDRGRTWSYIDTGYTGSFWCGAALPDGTLLVGGLRGSLYRSNDDGASWTRVETGAKASITSIIALSERTVVAVGVDGLYLRSDDGGQSFHAVPGQEHASLTAAVATHTGRIALMSRTGPVR